MNATTTAIKVTVSPQAADWLLHVSPAVKAHIIDMIRAKSSDPSLQMVVMNWTCQLPDHIYRCMKDYAYRPGVRVIFHVKSSPSGIHVDRIAWRDADPYLDGR